MEERKTEADQNISIIHGLCTKYTVTAVVAIMGVHILKDRICTGNLLISSYNL